jgi:diguanylate cyclase (GGDEF)-like protein
MKSINQAKKKKIFITEVHSSTQKIIQQELEKFYLIFQVARAEDIFELIKIHRDLSSIIIGITKPQLNNLKITSLFKKDFSTCHIPIILLVNQTTTKNISSYVEAGVDDYIKTPINKEELKARLTMAIRRSERDQNSNPLTKLPGSFCVNKIILENINSPLAILYADLDNFKIYNDIYGYEKGNNFIIFTAEEIITTTVKTHGNKNDFVGHIGGDDFIIVTTPNKAETISQKICKSFDQKKSQFFDTKDKKNKKLVVKNRKGKIQEFPITSISIAIITNEKKELTSIAQISQLVTEIKKYAKSKPLGEPGSNYVKDRRES